MPEILAFSSDADYWLARNLDWPVTEEGVRAYWEAQRAVDPGSDPEWFALVIELTVEGKAIGQVGLGVIKTGEYRQGTVGWLLGRKYQGQGLATEAARALVTYGLDELGMLRITARTSRDNRRSWHLSGCAKESVLKEIPETEEECVIREMKEETGLEVRVERLLLDEPGPPDGAYKRRKTYLCRPVAGVAKPGYEPEPEAAAEYAITAVQWLDLRDDSGWEEGIKQDPFTYPQLESLRDLLRYGGS